MRTPIPMPILMALTDGAAVAAQFRKAGAIVDHHELGTGHDWEPLGLDRALSRDWFSGQFASKR